MLIYLFFNLIIPSLISKNISIDEVINDKTRIRINQFSNIRNILFKMKKKKAKDSKRYSEGSIHSRIIDRIGSLGKEFLNFRSDGEYVLWIKRIINFIENEFPEKKKYQKIISTLNSLIKDDIHLKCTTFEARRNVPRILLDLAHAYDFDLSADIVIKFHPKVNEVSLDLFKNKHYGEAIFEAVKALNNYVKNKAKITDKDLSGAMAKAFDENNPIIKLNDLNTQSDLDEQKGFKLLFMGTMTGIRNPKAHENIKQYDRSKTIEYLASISLLFRRTEEGKL